MGKTVLGSTIEPLAVLPKANRVDTQVSIACHIYSSSSEIN